MCLKPNNSQNDRKEAFRYCYRVRSLDFWGQNNLILMARHFPFAVSWGAWIFIKIDADANLINNIPRARYDAFLIQSIHIQSYWLLFILNFGKRLDSSTCFTKGGETFYTFMDIQLSIPPPIHSILRRLMRSLLIDAITEIYESTRKSLMNNFAPPSSSVCGVDEFVSAWFSFLGAQLRENL